MISSNVLRDVVVVCVWIAKKTLPARRAQERTLLTHHTHHNTHVCALLHCERSSLCAQTVVMLCVCCDVCVVSEEWGFCAAAPLGLCAVLWGKLAGG